MSDSDTGEVGGTARRSLPHSPVRESGLTAIKESRMLNRAIRNGWIKGQRWPTEATPRDLQEKQQAGELTMKEQAATATFLDLTINPDSFKEPRQTLIARRLRQMAVRNVIAMEAQNQDDDLVELRALLQDDQGRGLSAEVIAALLHEVGDSLRESLGDVRAREIVAELQQRITVDTTATGTSITPDMEAAAMDATVPDGPEEPDAP